MRDFDNWQPASTCHIMGALIGGTVLQAGSGIIGNLLGSGAQQDAAENATNFQMGSQDRALLLQKMMYDQARGDLGPYREAGQTGLNELLARMPELTAGIDVPTMNQADLEATPGYKFTLEQALKAQQQSVTTRGLGLSGAALKGAADYATGVSDQTYNTRFNQAQQQFQDKQSNQANAWNRLFALMGTGQNAAAQTGAFGTQTGVAGGNVLAQIAGMVGGNMIGAGNAQAAGYVGAGNAFGNAAGGFGPNYMMSQLLPGMYGGGGFGGGATAP